ncbi:unnamed protein product, partial [Rotaria sp. Silwood2]
FSILNVALRLLHKLLPKSTREQLFEIAQILSVAGPNECQYWKLEIYNGCMIITCLRNFCPNHFIIMYESN